MYDKILVPVTPEHSTTIERSLLAARALLSPGGRITVMTVLEPIPGYVAQYLPLDQIDRNRMETEAELSAEFQGQSDIEILVETGHAAQMILEVAARDGHDCIIIASHKPGLQDYLLGSTAARVVRHAHCGVHVLR